MRRSNLNLDTIDGVLLVDKSPDMTSHDVVAVARRTLNQKKIGHCGTLDPMATGLLILVLGRGTKIQDLLMAEQKEYEGTIMLGQTTHTQDREGDVLETKEVGDYSEAQIRAAFEESLGDFEQTPPMVSAIKQDGVPLYKLARQGKTVERKPRPVEIYDIKLLDWSSPVLTIEVACSPGTYLRSLAHDLGQRLGCGAHLSSLTRLASGHFTLDKAVSLDALSEAFATGQWAELIRPLDEALLDFEAITFGSQAERQIRSGQQVQGPTPSSSSSLCRAYSTEGKLIALLQYDVRTDLWQPQKVFS